MGGCFLVPGNVTPNAEANIWNDPEVGREKKNKTCLKFRLCCDFVLYCIILKYKTFVSSQAADIVLSSFASVCLSPLDVTCSIPWGAAFLAKLKSRAPVLGGFVERIAAK
jgi:inosine-uridine nucleoside N-ribohydrolase